MRPASSSKATDLTLYAKWLKKAESVKITASFPDLPEYYANTLKSSCEVDGTQDKVDISCDKVTQVLHAQFIENNPDFPGDSPHSGADGEGGAPKTGERNNIALWTLLVILAIILAA